MRIAPRGSASYSLESTSEDDDDDFTNPDTTSRSGIVWLLERRDLTSAEESEDRLLAAVSDVVSGGSAGSVGSGTVFQIVQIC